MGKSQLSCVALAASIAACGGGGSSGDPDAGADGGGSGATARFAVAESGPMGFDDLPFPHDLHLGEDGTVDLADIPGETSDSAMHRQWRRALNERDGFCTICNTYFPIDGALDPASLPPDAAPGDDASPDDPVVMIDADPSSPERGRLLPVQTEWQPREGRLVVTASPEVVLHRNQRYAVALTDALLAADGSALAPSEIFAAVRNGTGSGPAVERARPIVAAALDELEAAGVERGRVVSAAVFTTDDPTEDVLAMRDVVHGGPAPELVAIDRVYGAADGSLDTLYGIPDPEDPGPGFRQPAEGEDGTRAVWHDHVGHVLFGRVALPRVLTGAGVDVGRPRRDGSGRLTSEVRDEVPFALAVPKDADLASLPVVVFSGNGQTTAGLAMADTFAERGIAVLAFATYQWGGRAASATDDKHNLRSDREGMVEGADGIGEHDVFDAYGRSFGLVGVKEGLEGLPVFGMAWHAQTTADVMSLVRFVRESDLSAIAEAATGLAGLAFDPAGVMLHGRFAGGGPVVAALVAETDAISASIALSDGGIVETVLLSPLQRDAAGTFLSTQFGNLNRFDGVERRTMMSAPWDFYRWTVEPLDLRALGRYVLHAPLVAGLRPHLLWVAGRFDEEHSPCAVEPALAALGLHGIGDFAQPPLPAATAPLAGNVTSNGGEVTAGAYLLEAGGRADILTAQPSRYEPPACPPFVRRDEPVELVNPIEDLHALVGGFARAAVDGGATIPAL